MYTVGPGDLPHTYHPATDSFKVNTYTDYKIAARAVGTGGARSRVSNYVCVQPRASAGTDNDALSGVPNHECNSTFSIHDGYDPSDPSQTPADPDFKPTLNFPFEYANSCDVITVSAKNTGRRLRLYRRPVGGSGCDPSLSCA